MGIIRDPTPQETDLTPIGSEGDTLGFVPIATAKNFRIFSPMEKFHAEVQKKVIEINAQNDGIIDMDKKILFADGALIDDVKSGILEREIHWKKLIPVGTALDMNKIAETIIKETKWEKYSDKKNFKLINKIEVADKSLSKNKPYPVKLWAYAYQFKGHRRKYTIMETINHAEDRARKKFKEII